MIDGIEFVSIREICLPERMKTQPTPSADAVPLARALIAWI
jgi:hypothetical protein